MPDGADRRRLERRILGLAARLGTEPFQPHVTLLSGLEAPARELLAAAERAAAQLRSLTVSLGGLDGREEHFRCLFVRVRDEAVLRSLHADLARSLGREPDQGFFPHLSLVYGSLRPPEKRALADEIGREADVGFLARRLHLWRTDGPVREWYEAGSFPLAAG
jgi:2'-5' RNA ligase